MAPEGCANLRHRMSLFANYRADRLIAEVKSSGNAGSPLAQKALEKLVALGPSAIEPIVAALTHGGKARDPGLRRSAVPPDRRQNPAPIVQDHGGRQRPRHVRDRVGAVVEQELSGQRAARRAGQAGHAQAGHSRCHRRAKEPLHGARTLECRLHPGAERKEPDYSRSSPKSPTNPRSTT